MSGPLLNRRQLLVALGIGALSGPKGMAQLLEELVPNPAPHYYPAILSRLYAWYNSQFFDFDQHLSRLERAYLKSVIENTRNPYWRDATHELVLRKIHWSARIHSNSVNYSRLSAGYLPEEARQRALALDVLRHRGVQDLGGLKPEQITGLGWDIQESSLKVYFLLNGTEANKYLSTLKASAEEHFYPPYLVASLKFKGKSITERRATVFLKSLPQKALKRALSQGSVTRSHLLLSSQRPPVYYHEFERFNAGQSRVDQIMADFSDKIRDEFLFSPSGFIKENENDATLYFT